MGRRAVERRLLVGCWLGGRRGRAQPHIVARLLVVGYWLLLAVRALGGAAARRQPHIIVARLLIVGYWLLLAVPTTSTSSTSYSNSTSNRSSIVACLFDFLSMMAGGAVACNCKELYCNWLNVNISNSRN